MTKPQSQTRAFIAIDGEGITVAGHHRYVMLCASSGEYVENTQGLTTQECLNFLIALRRRYDDAIFVSFSFSYDRTKLLRDIVFQSKVHTWHLWHNITVPWISNGRKYRVGGVDKKWLQVSRGDYSVRLYDVSSYWQTSFVRALESAGIADEMVARMKRQRSVFTLADIDTIREYCFQECKLLVDLMNWLRDAFNSVELPQGRWHGPGAVADATLRKHNVGNYHKHEVTYGGELGSVCRHSYFGGRAQTLLLGTVPEVWQYDIVSAYPSVTRNLPTAHGRWTPVRCYSEAPWAVWLCKWRIPGKLSEGYFGPFPWRHKNGSLFYPRSGYGWYWQWEVSEALRMWPGCIDIERGIIFTPESDARPFAFIDEMFAKRKELKARGHAGQLALKLAMNSVYGKLAQGVGGRDGKVPRWQSYFWAGNITSATRAELLRLADVDRENVIGFATDSVFYRCPVPLRESKELGGLELTYFYDAFFAQQGMYQGYIDGVAFEKTRSFVKGGLDWNDIRRGWLESGTDYVSRRPLQMFISLGLASARGDFSQYGEWVATDKELTLRTREHQSSFFGKSGRGTYPLDSAVLQHLGLAGREYVMQPLGNAMPDENGQKRAWFVTAPTDAISAPYNKVRIYTTDQALKETAEWQLDLTTVA